MNYKPPESDLKGNELKTFVQVDVNSKLATDRTIALEGATGFGKTNTGLLALARHEIDYRDSQLPNLVIVPTIPLKDQWESLLPMLELKKLTHVIVVNGFVFKTTERLKFGLVIVDEAHRVLNDESEWFSTALDKIQADETLLLSATFSAEHKKFLETKRPGINYYRVSLAWCVKNGLVPDHVNINIPVSLSLTEKSEMIKVQGEYDKYARHFAQDDIRNPFIDIRNDVFYNIPFRNPETGLVNGEREWSFRHPKGTTIGMLNKWKAATNARSRIYHNANAKLEMANAILQIIEDKKRQKCLIFAKNIDAIEALSKLNNLVTCYHSKCSEKRKVAAFTDFFTEIKPFFATINTIIEGFDMKMYAESLGLFDVETACQLAVRMAYESGAGKTIQTIGRILRYNPSNPDQQAIMFNIYVDDFQIRGKEYASQEKKWLISNLKGQVAIKWIETIDEIEL